MIGTITLVDDASAVAHAAAEKLGEIARAVLADRNRFLVALSGGRTPQALYELLATPTYRERIDWPRVEIFFGDERCVPPTDPESNYRMARQALLDHVPLAADHVHRIAGERPPAEAAAAYEATLRRVAPLVGGVPHLDLVLLGMGADGHTASLFPGTTALDERRALATPVYAPMLEKWRVTLTVPVLSAAAHAIVLVTGRDKARALKTALEGPAGVSPIQLVQPSSGELTWVVDREAAAELESPRR